MEKFRYHEMLPHEIVARRKRFPAAFIGLGRLEWHAEHMAVGNDALKAERLCELAAERSGGFAFPTLWYGDPPRLIEANHDEDGAIKRHMGFQADKWTSDYYGKTEEEQTQFYQELLYHMLIQMNALEMKAVCFVAGHYPLVSFARPVVARFNEGFKDTQAFAGREFEYAPEPRPVSPPATNARWFPAGPGSDSLESDPRQQAMWYYERAGGDHAGKWETSYLWYLRPDCVDMSIYRGRQTEPLMGVIGLDPRTEASIEIGRQACKLIVEGLIRKAKELIERAD